MDFLITNKGKRLGLEHVEGAVPVENNGKWAVEVKLKPIPFTITETMDFHRTLANVFDSKAEAAEFIEEINESLS